MSYDQLIQIWLWSNGISVAISFGRMVVGCYLGIMGIVNRGNGINIMILSQTLVTSLGALVTTSVFLWSGLVVFNTLRPETEAGIARTGTTAMVYTLLCVVITVGVVALGVLDIAIYRALEKKKGNGWKGEERRKGGSRA